MSHGRDSGTGGTGGTGGAGGAGGAGGHGGHGRTDGADGAARAARQDVVLVGPPVDDGGDPSAHHVLRLREGRVELGELRPAREGAPVLGELLSLRQRAEHERAFDVEVLARGPLARQPSEGEGESEGEDAQGERRRGERAGPPQVASAAYRTGWERTFGSKSN